MIKRDNIHLNGRRLDSYNKPFNFFITERETGKSTWAYSKMYKTFIHHHRRVRGAQKGRACIYAGADQRG